MILQGIIMSKVTLYIDCVSPYAYFAFEVLEAYKKLWNINVNYEPISLGIVMKESGNRPPIMVPNKGAFMTRDIQRTCKMMGIKDFDRPKAFPYNSMKAQRILQAIKMSEGDADYIACAREFWRAGWVHHVDMVSPEGLAGALSKVLSQEKAESYVQRGDDKEVKAGLVANTNYVLEHGCFGLPYICVEKDGQTEWYWGNDRWEQIADFLSVEWKGYQYCQQSMSKL